MIKDLPKGLVEDAKKLLQKEEDYKEQIKKWQVRQDQLEYKNEKIEQDGFFISKKLLNKESNRVCPVCSVYSFEMVDDLYMGKYDCCFKCYIKWVEHREDRWFSGWRPNTEEIDNGNNV